MPTTVPANYALFNSQSTKQLVVVVKIDGAPDLLASAATYTRIRYGDPILYGDPGLVYGGLRKVPGVKDYLSLDGSSLAISQRLEPEQGRAAVSTVSLSFIDKDGYMTALVSPGVVLDDILGKEVTVYLGYQEISYPEDYFVITRGRISGVQTSSGMVVLSLSDPNLGRKQNVFYVAKTSLSTSIDGVTTTVPVIANGDFHKSILGPAATYDSGVKLYLSVEDEMIEYGPSASLPGAVFGTNTFTGVTRGARGTVAAAHASGAAVEARAELSGHAIDIALKLMLSGFNGAWKTGVPLYSIVKTGDPILLDQPGTVILPPKVDANIDYGIVSGDYLTISGSGIGGNNITVKVLRLAPLSGDLNRIIYTDGALTSELPSPAVLAIRSQYDVYPTTFGVKLKETEVDITGHQSIKQQFLSTAGYNLRFFITEQTACKSFIESECYLPVSLYSLTKNGRLSLGLTHAPIADSGLLFLTEDNVLDPQNIKPKRDLNQSRKFFNQIDYAYDANDAGNFTNTLRTLDTDSLNIIGISSVLPISSKGARTDLGYGGIVQKQASFLLSRYKRGATVIECKVNWQVGCRIESGDVVALQDGGTLQISNFSTGTRDFGTQLVEVLDRTLNIKDGNVSLKLINGLGADITDRYATFAPSSIVSSGSTTSSVIIQDSYGAIFPGNEQAKWTDYIGLKIHIHSANWTTYSQYATINGFSTTNPYAMDVSGLTLAPSAGYIIDITEYPNNTDKTDQQTYKVVHCFLDPSVPIVSGVSSTQFTVSAGNIGKFLVKQLLLIHNASWSILSPEVTVTDVNTGTNTVTVGTSLGFTPAAGQTVELIGFPDGGGAYRYI